MATPKVITDGSSDLDEAVLNKFLSVAKVEVKVNYFRLHFVAATNAATVLGTVDSDGEVVDGDLSWNAGSVRVDIVLSGFTAQPLVLAALTPANASTNVAAVAGQTTGTTAAYIEFLAAGAGAGPVDPNDDIDVAVLLIGV